jgi:DNA segregation ATPase FtsK/SpoIIIE, S-DNA-T family
VPGFVQFEDQGTEGTQTVRLSSRQATIRHSGGCRARAYLVTDTDAATTAAQHAPHRPDLDPASATALADPAPPADPPPGTDPDDPDTDPEAAFWTALRAAPDDGLTVADLMRATGKRRTWIYDRLTHHTRTGRVTQLSRGRWRATTSHEP